MEKRPVHIDFNILKMAIREHVRKKAMAAGSFIIYMEKGEIIKEDPKTSKKINLHTSPSSLHS
jgi:hypothetical protein